MCVLAREVDLVWVRQGQLKMGQVDVVLLHPLQKLSLLNHIIAAFVPFPNAYLTKRGMPKDEYIPIESHASYDFIISLKILYDLG